jgi:hypothetical protein
MSTILKALRRLEEEKLSERAASLEEDVTGRPVVVPNARRGGLVVGIAAGASIALALGGVAYLLLGSSPQRIVEDSDRVTAPSLAVERAVERAAERRVQRAPETRESPRVPPAVAAARAPAPALPAAPIPSAALGTVEAVGSAAGSAERTPEAAALRTEVSQAPPQALAPAPIPAVEPVPAPALAVAPKPAVAETRVLSRARPAASRNTSGGAITREQPSALADIEVLERRPIPALRVTQTSWHPDPSRRIATVKLAGRPPQRLAEGDVVAGFTVVEIGLSEVWLERDGVSLKRRVGGR